LIRRTVLAVLMASGFAHGANCRALRVSSAADASTLDPHGQAISTNYQLIDQIYEPLVAPDDTLKLVPSLAASWDKPEPNRWRFHLRQGVSFHDGAPFTATDVAFSLVRAAKPGSGYANYLDSVVRTEIVDPSTIDVITRNPDPILLNKLSKVYIMNRAWSEAHELQDPPDPGAAAEAYSVRHENGTGPFRLTMREPGLRTELASAEHWWGTPAGNVTEYISVPIASNATRTAALLSGAVDIVLDPAVNDVDRLKREPQLRVVEGPELRTIFLELDQFRTTLLGGDTEGRNPFKDRRVRRALYQAIDIDSIINRLMRGLAQPAGMVISPGVHGYEAALDTRLAFDPEASRRLLAEAGYPSGFSVAMDCPNNRYVNDAQVCAAVAAMWSKVGVRAALNAIPYQAYFPRLAKQDVSIYLLGYGAPTLDAYNVLQAIYLPRGTGTDGLWNLGYANPEVTALVHNIEFETDLTKRDAQIHRALVATNEDVAVLPLYRSIGAWAMRANVHAIYRADTLLAAKSVRIEE
jgi:peptide/nickel transport system substrate-binding protein